MGHISPSLGDKKRRNMFLIANHHRVANVSHFLCLAVEGLASKVSPHCFLPLLRPLWLPPASVSKYTALERKAAILICLDVLTLLSACLLHDGVVHDSTHKQLRAASQERH